MNTSETMSRILSRIGYRGIDAEVVAIVESDDPKRLAFIRAAQTVEEKLAMIDIVLQLGFRYTRIRPSNHPKVESFTWSVIRSLLAEIRGFVGAEALARTSA